MKKNPTDYKKKYLVGKGVKRVPRQGEGEMELID